MPRFKPTISILSLILVTALLGCQPSPPSSSGEETRLVSVSVLPQAYFVERIGGDQISVNVMVGPGDEAHTYEPTPQQMRLLTQSSLFLSIGVEYEDAWLSRFADINPEMRIVDSSAGIDRIPMPTHLHAGEAETEEADADHLDPHVWLSPLNAKIIGRNTLDALTELVPEKAAQFEANYQALISDIDLLDQEIQAALADKHQRAFMVFHPAWGYFAREYHLEQVAIQTGGQDPTASELSQLVDLAREKHIEVIFIQPGYSRADAEALAEEINGQIVTVDPLAKDWLTNLRSAADAFASAIN